MASTATIGPSLGHAALFTQSGVTAGYDAIDLRRLLSGAGVREGLLSDGSYLVSQRGAGANMSVDVAAPTGSGMWVQGDSVGLQGMYYVPPASAVLNVDIAAADATNPRNDLVVVEIKDDTHDASGLNLARVRVITGTPNASAVLTDAPGSHGTPALPDSAIPLAVVNVPASDTSITDSQIDDRRYRTGGYLAIQGSETRTSGANYGFLTTPDQIRNVVVPAGHIIRVGYNALWQESVAGAARAAIFIGANQQKIGVSGGVPVAVAAATGAGSVAYDTPLLSHQGGLASAAPTGVGQSTTVATGQAIGAVAPPSAGDLYWETGGSVVALTDPAAVSHQAAGGFCEIFADPGTYDIRVKFKTSSGTVSARARQLWVTVEPYIT